MKNRKKSKEGRFIVGCGGPFGFIIKNENGLYINPKLFCKGYIKWMWFSIITVWVTVIIYIIIAIFDNHLRQVSYIIFGMTSICPISTIYYIFHYIAVKKQIKKEELTNSKFIPTFMFCLPMHENGKFFNPKLYCKGFIKWLLFAIMLTIITIIVYIILGIFFHIWDFASTIFFFPTPFIVIIIYHFKGYLKAKKQIVK